MSRALSESETIALAAWTATVTVADQRRRRPSLNIHLNIACAVGATLLLIALVGLSVVRSRIPAFRSALQASQAISPAMSTHDAPHAEAVHPMRSSLVPSLMRDSLSNMPPAPKRRAFSVSDRGLYRGASSSASAARRAVSSAFSNVTRFVRTSSNGSSTGDRDGDAATESSEGDANSMTEDPMAQPATRTRSYSATISSWKISSKLPQVPSTLKALRRPRQLSLRRGSVGSTGLVPWNEGHVQYVSSSYSLHGEDAGSISSYYHIVADGISAPFAGQAPDSIPADRVGSDVISKALVRSVEQALEDATNRNKESIDAAAFEHTLCEAIRATRVLCAKHRESRIATTLCVAYFDRWNSKLLSFTLGDSKCLVVRQGEIVFESTCTVREFNVPCVVNLSHPLEPNDYLVESFDLVQGDVCLTFSDGITDNLYKDDVLTALEDLENDASTLQQICEGLVSQSTLEGAAALEASPPPSAEKAAPQESLLSTSPPTEPEAETSSEHPLEELDLNTTPACPTDTLRERLDSTSMKDDEGHANPAPNLPTSPPPPESQPPRHKKRFYPFATAAAYEYRRRVLRQKKIAPPQVLADKNFQRHVRDSKILLDLHDGKSVIDRQMLVLKAQRRPHYSLVQLHRMAQIRAMKPDDVTLLVSRFV